MARRQLSTKATPKPAGTTLDRAKPGTPSKLSPRRAARLQSILDAALDVFAESGFADAKLDDVAARAGIAKGTLYLYVDSKEHLFETLVRTGIAAPIQAMQARVASLPDRPVADVLRLIFTFVRTDILATRRKEIARLILTEAARFPAIAELYHREVIQRGLGVLRALVERGVSRGELHSDALARFPHLIIAPALVALIWSNLFEQFEPLDVESLFETHITLILRAMGAPDA